MKFNLFSSNKKKIGIVLSGGAARGYAHLGVLKALEEKDIYPQLISGVSAGALAGAFYADGMKPDEIFKVMHQNNIFKFAKLSIPRGGLLSIDNLSKILKENLKSKTFEDLKYPLYVAAANLNEGKIEYFHKGELVPRIVASASIPVLFKPIKINNTIYVDGGVFDNMPIDPIKEDSKRIIAVHVNPVGREDDLDSLMKIAERTFHLTVGSKMKEKAKQVDLYIEPKKLKDYGLLSVSKAKEIFEIGYEETQKALEQINIKNFQKT